MNTAMRRLFARVCILNMLFLSLVAPVQAGMISVDDVLTQETVQSDRAQVSAWMQRDEVRAQFAALGVDAADIEQRVAALSDAEVSLLAEEMDEQPAGGLLAVIGVVFVVLLILELVGVIDIFKNVGPVSTR